MRFSAFLVCQRQAQENAKLVKKESRQLIEAFNKCN